MMSVALCLALLAACSVDSANKARTATRAEAYWPERAIVFLADAEAGVVSSFNVRSGVTPLGKIVTPARASVLALSLDIPAKRLWVLDGGALHSYDAVTLKPVRRWSAPGAIVLTALERDIDGAVLAVAADGHRYRPDPSSFALKAVNTEQRLAITGDARIYPAIAKRRTLSTVFSQIS
ncbi:MAG TPA: hypothetical protein VM532_14925 [Burkholderiales bacterium]|nr:hypothetical protein [Burkholderiales bacterium]